MSIQIMTAVWQLKGLTTGQKIVLLSLADNANDDGVCWPSYPQIAKRCCMTADGVRAVIKKLGEAGYLSRTSPPGKTSVYHLTPEKGRPCISDTPVSQIPPYLRYVDPVSEIVSPTPPIKTNRQEPSLTRARTREGTGEKKNTFTLPDWIPPHDWSDYEVMRTRMGKSMTGRAKELAVKKLDELRAQGHSVSAVLQQSIFNSWQGLFALKSETVKTGWQSNRQQAPQKKHVINLMENQNA